MLNTGSSLSAPFGNFENFTGGSLVDIFALTATGVGTVSLYTGTTTGTLNNRWFQSIEMRR